MKTAFLIGRALLGGFFVYNGIHHFQETEMIAGYAKSKNLPMPKAAVLSTGAALIVGGASLITGVKPKYGIAAVVGFLATVSPTVHDFWNAQDPQQKMNDQINFMKNIALAGATLALAEVEEPWPASLPIAQPSRYEQAMGLGRSAQKLGREKVEDVQKFGREKLNEADKRSRKAKKSARKWFAA
jgi:putative oxidoreductase